MKKSLIALAVAGAMTAPLAAQADVDIYGEYVGYISQSDATGSDLEIGNDTIELGFTGTVDNGIEGIETGFDFLYESDADASENAQFLKANGYISGAFGTFTIGKQDNPADITEDLGLMGGEFLAGGDEFTAAGYMFESDAFWVNAAIGADGTEDTDSVAQSALGAGFSVAGVGVALGYENTSENTNTGDAETDLVSLVATYELDNMGFFINYQDFEEDNNGEEFDVIDLGATVGLSVVNLYAEYGIKDVDGVADEDEQILLGVEYPMGDAYVALEWSDFDYGDAAEEDESIVAFHYGLAW